MQNCVECDVTIEVPAHSGPILYKVDSSGVLFVDKFLATSMHYPCDYGYIASTLSHSGTLLEALVISPRPVHQGCIISSRIIGMLTLTQGHEENHKILAVPAERLTSLYAKVYHFEDLPKTLLDQIEHFFSHCNDLESNNKIKFEGWLGPEAANKEMAACNNRYKHLLEGKKQFVA